MKISKCITMALESIWNSKSRSALTMLGIIIGVAAVIGLMSLMNGLTGMVTSNFEEMGTTTITVSITSRGTTREITPEEMTALVDENPDVLSAMTPMVTVSGMIKNGGEYITSSATGVSADYAEIGMIDLALGRFLSYMDVEEENPVCVIGSYVARELFGTMECLDEYIKVNGQRLSVIGVIEEDADSEQGSSDECVYFPYTIAQKMSFSTTVGSYTLTATDEDSIDAAVSLIEALCYSKIGDDDYYTVTSMKELIETMEDMIGTMELALAAIAGISLLVAGIGIMNIMLVTVTERTREIGIRKSLGAKGRSIMEQFVIEAGVISTIGGIIGIFAGAALAAVMGSFLGITATPSVGAICLAFGVSVAIGLIFGYLPASKAAKLNPIDALRYD